MYVSYCCIIGTKRFSAEACKATDVWKMTQRVGPSVRPSAVTCTLSRLQRPISMLVLC